MGYFAGLDVSVKETSVCIVDDAGKDGSGSEGRNAPEALLAVLKQPTYLCRKPKSGRIGDAARQPGHSTRCVRSAEPSARPVHPCPMSGMFSRCCSSSRKILGFCANAVRPMR